MPKSSKPAKPTEMSSLELAEKLADALERVNPELAALCRQGIKEHREAVEAGRWKPLR